MYQGKTGNNQLHSLENKVDKILAMKSLTEEEIKSLLDDIRSYADLYGSKKKLNTSQLRNVFSKVLHVNEATEPSTVVVQLQLIRPKLMYVAARQQNRDAKRIIEFFEKINIQENHSS